MWFNRTNKLSQRIEWMVLWELCDNPQTRERNSPLISFEEKASCKYLPSTKMIKNGFWMIKSNEYFLWREMPIISVQKCFSIREKC